MDGLPSREYEALIGDPISSRVNDSQSARTRGKGDGRLKRVKMKLRCISWAMKAE